MENEAPTRTARIWRRAAAGGYFALLTFVLLAPDPLAWLQKSSPGPEKPWHWSVRWLKNDKLQHGVVYAVAGACLRAAALSPARTLAVCAAHGGGIELLQPWFPPRSCELEDWLADLCGAAAGIALYGLRRGRPPVPPVRPVRPAD